MKNECERKHSPLNSEKKNQHIRQIPHIILYSPRIYEREHQLFEHIRVFFRYKETMNFTIKENPYKAINVPYSKGWCVEKRQKCSLVAPLFRFNLVRVKKTENPAALT